MRYCVDVMVQLKGLAWSDIYAGRYFPTLSLYKGATVSWTAQQIQLCTIFNHHVCVHVGDSKLWTTFQIFSNWCKV